MTRPFEGFPSIKFCPFCGTNDDRQCGLIEIDGTSDGKLCQAQPVHWDCCGSHPERFRFNREAGLIYARALGQDKQNRGDHDADTMP